MSSKRGKRRVGTCIALDAPGALSAGEADFRVALRALAPDLTAGCVREYYFHPERGWRLDYAWPAARLAVEIDGGQWAPGGGRHATDKDREKLNEAAALGWRVLRFSPAMLADPAACVALARAALGAEGAR